MATTPLRDGIRLLGRAVAPGPAGVPDGDLLDRFVRHRDEAAFELIVWRHAAMVLGTCRRLLGDPHEAEDALQATFLVLARRAGSVRGRQSIGGWLHRVAFRMALLAKAKRAKRDARLRPLDERTPATWLPDPAAGAEWRDIRRALDDEVNRLPDAYRVPFVLCCLEGRTNADAARELGCPVGTVESRLTRARARLRVALVRRGIALSAGLLAALPAADALGFVPAALVSATAKAAVTPGVVPAHVAALTEGVIQAMWLSKLKTVAAIGMAVTVLGTGTGVLWTRPAAADPAGPAAKAPATDADRVADLVKRLGGSAFADRERAAKELEAIGAPALDALRQAARSDEPERKKRAEELVKRIEARADTAKMLAAKRVRLTYRDTPLAEAIEDFKTKSGYDIALSDPTGALKDRKVTLDTRDVTFWQAVDRFCDAAGLTETVPPPAQRLAAAGGGGGAGLVRGGGAGGGAVVGAATPVSPFVPAGRVTLADGKRPAVPTDSGSAVRVRAVGKADQPAADGEIVFHLEVTPEPRLRWQRAVGVDITKATDDQVRALEQIRAAEPAPAPPAAFAPGRAVAGGGFGTAGGPAAGARAVSVRFKKPAKVSTSLKELSGTIALQVLAEPEPYVTVDDILDAGGKTVQAADGGAVRVQKVLKLPSGRVQLWFGIDPAPGDPGGGAFNLTMRGGRVVLTTGPHRAEYEVVLVDAKGVPVPLAGAGVAAAGAQAQYNLVSQSADGGNPAKLVVAVSKSVTVNVPFTLRDVPVP